jgi:hypothetical protein
MPEEQVWQRGGQAAGTATGRAFGSSEQWKMRGGCFHTTTHFVPGSRVEAELSSERPVNIYQSTRYIPVFKIYSRRVEFAIKPLTPELNPSAQRCLTRFFTADFAS